MKIYNKYFVFTFFRVKYFTGIFTEFIYNTLKWLKYSIIKHRFIDNKVFLKASGKQKSQPALRQVH